MDIYHFFGRIIRYVIALVLLISLVAYLQEAFFGIDTMELVHQINGEYSFQLVDIDVKLALNDSTFFLKFEA